MFYGIFGLLHVSRVFLKVSLQIHINHILTLRNLMSFFFFFLGNEWSLFVPAKTLGCKLSYLGILFHLLTLAIQGGLEILGHKDTVCTRGPAPLQ